MPACHVLHAAFFTQRLADPKPAPVAPDAIIRSPVGISVGSRLGSYEVVSRLGAGGMDI